MKIKIWGVPEEGNQIVRILVAATDLPEDAAIVRLSVCVPELSAQEYYGETEVYTKGKAELTVICPCDDNPVFWGEFTPKLYEVKCQGDVVCANSENIDIELSRELAFNSFRPLGTQFAVAGRPVFIRGVMADAGQIGENANIDRYIKDIKKRGLNCIDIPSADISEKLLAVTDREGIYVKVEGEIDHERWSSFEHPSLVMAGQAVSGYADASVPWMEFAVRDRQDYSDAPDTKSDHSEDVFRRDYPTLLTHVGEWRNGVDSSNQEVQYLAQICCREEMEAALRTPQFGGFILQKDAAVMKMSGKLMREFAGPLVPMLMMKKYVWTDDETLIATVVIANYSDEKYYERISITATDEQGQRYTKMSNRIRINRGSLVNTGEITIPLSQFTPGQSIEIQVSVDDTDYRNHYTIWLFSDNISVKVPQHVHITRRLDDRTRQLLENGKKVVFIPKLNTLACAPGWFSPLASQAAAQREKVASGGVSCDASHPIFKNFATEETGDFQWWNLIHNSTPLPVTENLKDGRIVHMQEFGAYKTYIAECRVGQGKLIFSAIDLLIQLDRPEARQLYAGILDYVASDHFQPKLQMNFEQLEQLIK